MRDGAVMEARWVHAPEVPGFDSRSRYQVRLAQRESAALTRRRFAGSIPAPDTEAWTKGSKSPAFQAGRCGFESRRLYVFRSPVAQWLSSALLMRRLLVRAQSGELGQAGRRPPQSGGYGRPPGPDSCVGATVHPGGGWCGRGGGGGGGSSRAGRPSAARHHPVWLALCRPARRAASVKVSGSPCWRVAPPRSAHATISRARNGGSWSMASVGIGRRSSAAMRIWSVRACSCR